MAENMNHPPTERLFGDDSPTHKLMDDFFEMKSKTAPSVLSLRQQLDRPALYKYEEKIQKYFIEMNADEILDMFRSFRTQKSENTKRKLLSGSYYIIASLAKTLFDFYNERNAKLGLPIIWSPFNDPKMKGSTGRSAMMTSEEYYCKEDFETALKEIEDAFYGLKDRMIYYKCIYSLFYNGCKDGKDIAMIKTKDVNEEERTVIIGGIQKRLSDECFELLRSIHCMEEIDDNNGKEVLVMTSWQDSYFKYPIRKNTAVTFDAQPITKIKDYPTFAMSKYIYPVLTKRANHIKLYFLGFFDYIVSQCGREEANRITGFNEGHEATVTLMQYAREYGIRTSNPGSLRDHLAIYRDAVLEMD